MNITSFHWHIGIISKFAEYCSNKYLNCCKALTLNTSYDNDDDDDDDGDDDDNNDGVDDDDDDDGVDDDDDDDDGVMMA